MKKNARIYLRVSSESQDLKRQESIIQEASDAGYYVAGVYREKASGARADRPELLRMIEDLQPNDVVIAEKIDRISRLPLPEAERLIKTIKNRGAMLSIPGVIDLSELTQESDGVPRIVLESIQDMLLKIALQMARDDYEDRRERQKQGIAQAKERGKYKGRKANIKVHELIIKLRPYHTISETARLSGCSESLVKLVWSEHKKKDCLAI